MGKTVAVTGAERFTGSHLVEALVEPGHRVKAMVQNDSFNTLGWLDTQAPDLMAAVGVTPSEVCGSALATRVAEDRPPHAQSPYTASQIFAEKQAESFPLSYGLPELVLRPFNTCGPRRSARAETPTITSQSATGRGPITRGGLQPNRDITCVWDIASAFVQGSTLDDGILAGYV